MWNEYHLCTEIEEALHLLHRYDGEAKVIAGGTDLILQLEIDNQHVPALLDITRIPKLRQIFIKDDRIHIGAAVTFREVLGSRSILEHAPHLVSAAHSIAGRQIRNVATIGGNIINASPAADTAPVLYTLDAIVHYYDENMDEQKIQVDKFITGVKKTLLPRYGLVYSISFPIPKNGCHMRFRKLSLRRSMAISLVNTSVTILETDGMIKDARVAFGAVAPTPVRSIAAEKALIGLEMKKVSTSDAPQIARSSVSPIDDFRASSKYRLQMVENLLRESLRSIEMQDGRGV